MRLRALQCVVLVAGVLAVTSASASGDDNQNDKPKALSGTWVKKAGELKIEFSDKDVLRISPHGDDTIFVVLCTYTGNKEQTLKAKITGYEGKEEVKQKAKNLLPIGSEFSFAWRVKGDGATLDDLKGDQAETLKSHLEGEYERKP
jgi:hypothetical protein